MMCWPPKKLQHCHSLQHQCVWFKRAISCWGFGVPAVRQHQTKRTEPIDATWRSPHLWNSVLRAEYLLFRTSCSTSLTKTSLWRKLPNFKIVSLFAELQKQFPTAELWKYIYIYCQFVSHFDDLPYSLPGSWNKSQCQMMSADQCLPLLLSVQWPHDDDEADYSITWQEVLCSCVGP